MGLKVCGRHAAGQLALTVILRQAFWLATAIRGSVMMRSTRSDPTEPLSRWRCALLSLVIGVALIFATGPPVRADNEEAEAAYDRGDYDTAIVNWLAEAEAGDPVAQYNVATLFRTGKGAARNPEASVGWYTRAAEQGHLASQTNLGRIYLSGDGVQRDPELGLKWLRLAADEDFPPAQYYLGELYRTGEGVRVDLAQAHAFYLEAAEQGLPDAAFRLSHMYRMGNGVERDLNEARKWVVRAAVTGHPESQYHLAGLYYRGEGGDPDHVRAYFWYFHAARGGVERAVEMRDVIAGSLTKDQREELSRISGEVERVRREQMDR